MGLRKALNQNKSFSLIAAIVVIIGAGWFTYTSIRGTPMPPVPDSFYFILEGKTEYSDCFAAPMDSIPPFEHNGGTAVRARVFNINGRNTVVYVEKLTDAAKAHLEEVKASGNVGMPIHNLITMNIRETLVKRPGDTTWQPKASVWFQTNIAATLRGEDGLPLPEVFPRR